MFGKPARLGGALCGILEDCAGCTVLHCVGSQASSSRGALGQFCRRSLVNYSLLTLILRDHSERMEFAT